MKVLQIIASLDESTGGPARSVPQTCVELAKLGVEIEIICQPSPNPASIPELPNLKVRFLTYHELFAFSKKLNPAEVDLIHLQHIWTPYISIIARAARKKRIPYIITPRGMLEPWIMVRHPWKKKLAMALYQRNDIRRAALLHATAEMEKKNIRKLGFTNEIVEIPNGIDLSKVPPPKTTYGSKKVVFLSRIHPKKGIELLLEAWKQLQPNSWNLEIAGNGEPAYVKYLQKKIEREQISGVKLVDPQYGEAKWNFLKSADLFVLPTYSENFGIVIAEALAIGVPVITTTGTPWQELDTHNCGWWIELTLKNLKTVLLEGTNTPPTALRLMGDHGTKLIQENYGITVVAENIHRVYHKIINQQMKKSIK